MLDLWERETDTHIYFWNGIFCQWYPSKIVDKEGVTYNCGEQYMMSQKAKLFKDNDVYDMIMEENIPHHQKALGRIVSDYDDDVWNKHKFDIVVDGNCFKFSQNEELKRTLLSTEDKIIVEGSYEDPIWGVGLSYDDDLILDESNWQGENLLGKAIMVTRNEIGKI